MAKENTYFIRLKPYEPGKPMVKYRPAVVKGLVVAPNPKIASEKAHTLVKAKISAQFPKAELKELECKLIPFDFFINPEK